MSPALSEAGTAELYERCVAFLKHIEEAAATSTEPWRWGTAFFNTRYPNKYARNFLRIEVDDPEATAEAMVAEAERVQGEAGLAHRRINGFGDVVEKHVDGFRAVGWDVDRIVMLIHDGTIRERPVTVPVERRHLDDMRDVIIAWDQQESSNTPSVSQQLADAREVLYRASEVDFLCGMVDDEVGGWAELYRREDLAQIESVMTFTQYRNLGVATSAVNEGLRLAYESGAEHVFLLADDDDWPKEMYARLGFTPIGRMAEFTRPMRRPKPE